MTATDADNIAGLDYMKGRGNTIRLHSGDPGTTGANVITTTPASATTTWGTSSMGSGGDAGYAVVAGSNTDFTLPASTTATHYGIYNGSTYLRGYPLDASLTSNAQPLPVTFPPRMKFKG
ncbi:hypothetical protein ACXYTP_00170 [Tsukamurella ocularis]|uniref:hypothetical protein n=1 Tax=Tsukamurella ocularis TaxID=1970234 RepID=UPI0039EE10F6